MLFNIHMDIVVRGYKDTDIFVGMLTYSTKKKIIKIVLYANI